ncbi:MAG TPA: chromosome segregation protein SMC [Oscillospiraceae bacterium]|nr:chromosome segregation protein SMC [Oscillospiraceae bacterium]HPS35305.1 chromosome segregation protein SMC [Oscillospiraceae bacterium]
MFLKSVEMFGFKSFPERTRLSFRQGVTVVVGPNGCGKSNISDAIRWVFGERSSKALRSKKMEDVIFLGTSDRPASGLAEVSLTLDNSDRSLDLDEDEVCVTRRIYRSGETEYLINKKPVRLADLLEMFMDTGLGRDGYSLIGQGKIAEVVSAKSEERREIFEEAAGISKHRFRREEAEHNLERAGENLVRLTDIAGVLEARIEPLRIEAEKAKQYLALSAEKTGLELGVWLNTIQKSEAAVKKCEADEETAKAQAAESEIESRKAEQAIQDVFNDSQTYILKIDSLRRETDTHSAEISDCRSKIEIAKGDSAHRQSDIARITGQQKQLEQTIGDSGTFKAESKKQIEEKETQCKALENGIAETEAAIAKLNSETGGAEKRFTELFAEIETASQKVNDLKIAQIQLKSNIEQAEQRLAEHREALDTRTPQLAEAREEAKFLAEDSARITADITKCRNSREGLVLKLENLRAKQDGTRESIGRLEVEIGQALHKAQTLEEMEQQMEGYGGAVKAVLESRSLKGICGVVGRLITVPEQYATAIEIALGGALQHMITDDEQQAKYAINFLKQNNLGRATFLPVSAVTGDLLPEGEFMGKNGYVGIGAQLIQYDIKYTGVMRRLLGRTAVFEDLDSALAAAKQNGYKYRIVTLDGQVVNSGGSLTGGSLGKGSGALSRGNQIMTLRETAAKFKKQSDTLKSDLEALAPEVTAAQRAVDTQAETITGLSEEKVRIDLSLTSAQRQQDELSELIANSKVAVKNLNKQLETDKKALISSDSALETASKHLDEKTAESRALSEGRTDFFTRREALLAEIADKKLKIAENRKDIGILESGIAVAGEDVKAKAEQIAALECEKSAIESAEQTGIQTISALDKRIAELTDKVNGITERINATIALRETTERRMREARESERAIMTRREALVAEQARLQERRLTAQRDFDSTVARLMDEYGLTRSEASKKASPIQNLGEANKTLSKLREKIRALGSVNTGAEQEYAEVSKQYNDLKKQIDDIEKSREKLRNLITELNATMTGMFEKTFAEINKQFSAVFSQLFGGGRAELLLEDPGHVLDCGIEIKAQPPGKSIKNLEQLSGGEQSFLAIAIYFAILKVKPSPFCLLDEIEAALDEVNVRRFAEYLAAMCGNTQFIVITHRRGTMEIADTLYGVTMRQAGQTGGISKIIELNITDVEQKLGIKI